MKNKSTFIYFYIILTGIEIFAESSENLLLVYMTKPLLVISLSSFFLNSKSTAKIHQKRLFLLALFFALCGDTFLMIRSIDLFIPGLASFLIMQLFYISLFRQQITTDLLGPGSLISLIPFLACAVALFIYISPALSDAIIRVSVAIYAASISIMSWLALRRRQSVSRVSFLFVFLGALLFMVSDSLIAIHRFIAPVPAQAFWIMSTYAAAQMLITLGVTIKSQAD